MAPPDTAAALSALARATTWAEAVRLYGDATGDRSHVGAETAFQAAAAQGWLLSSLPDLRLLIEAWQAVARVQDDALRARRASAAPLGRLVKTTTDTAPDAIRSLSESVAKLTDSATRAESIALSGLSIVARMLDRWRRSCVAFEAEYEVKGRECVGEESWRRACKKLLRIQIAEGDLAMALRLVPMVRTPEALTDQHLDPVLQARAQAEDLERQRRAAAAMGDTAALVQLAPAIDRAVDRVQVLSGETGQTIGDEVREAADALAADLARGRAE